MPLETRLLPLLRPVDIKNQQLYMRLTTKLLRRAGVTVEGRPLWVAPSVYLDSKEKGIVTLGDRCVISEHVLLLTHDYSLDRYSDRMGLAAPDMQYVSTGPIRIGAYAFIGIRSIIMPGVEIGDGAIVGAGSVVTKSVDPGMVAAGNPARVLGTVADAWDRNSDRWNLTSRRP